MTPVFLLAGTRSDRRCLVERSGFDVRCRYAAIIFSFVIGIDCQQCLHTGGLDDADMNENIGAAERTAPAVNANVTASPTR
jgi:hypothetical protein